MAKPPSAERADPTRDVASVQRIVIPRPTTSLSHILASLPNEVEFAQAWPEFGRGCPVMLEFGRHGQAIRRLFRTVYRCLLPRLRNGRSRSEHAASAFEGIVSMSDYAVAMDSRRDNARVNRATSKGVNLRVEWMVKWQSHHPRNEPAQTRDVASVQRIVIQRLAY